MGQCMLPPSFCCWELRQGAKFIGRLCFLVSLILAAFLLYYLFTDNDNMFEEISDNDPHVRDNLNESKTLTLTTAVLLLGILILHAISSFLLQSDQKSRNYILPFLVTTAILIVLTIIFAIFQFNQEHFFVTLTVTVILVYFFLCALSLHNEMKYGADNRMGD